MAPQWIKLRGIMSDDRTMTSCLFLWLLFLFALTHIHTTVGSVIATRVHSGRHPETVLHGHIGSDRNGHVLRLLDHTSTSESCAQLCINTPQCEAWSFADETCQQSEMASSSTIPMRSITSGNECTLMSTRGVATKHECRISGAPAMGLIAPKYPRLPVSAVQPLGWLLTELKLQQDGLGGHEHEFYDCVMNSEFIGGYSDTPSTNHERFLYWFNGQVSMGHLVNDSRFSNTVKNFTDLLIKNQSSDGFLGPPEGNRYDPWPRMLMMYVFQQYHEIYPEDERVVPAMMAYFHFLWNQFSDPKYDPNSNGWANVRIEDMQTTVEYMYDHYGAKLNQSQFLLDLNELLYMKSWNWVDYYRDRFPTGDIGHSWNLYDHGVNNGQALKSAALWYRQSQSEVDVESTYLRLDKMERFHGQASGIFSCDECLAGLAPNRGTELCTIVESMFSHEIIFSVFGDVAHFDKVEQMAFNAFPATMTPDLWAHQYLQQSNEIDAVHQDRPVWNSDGGDANIYGLEVSTTNMPQGWPKLIASAWLMTQEPNTAVGILAALLGPSQLSITLQDEDGTTNAVTIQQITDYPHVPNGDVKFVIQNERPFPFSFRVPGWAAGSTLTLSNGTIISVHNGTVHTIMVGSPTRHQLVQTITLHLKYSLRSVRRYNNAISIYYGPLLMALEFGFNTTVLKKYSFQSSDLQYLPTAKWNYALQVDEDNLDNSFKISYQLVSGSPYPWDPLHPTITLSAYGREINWPMKYGGADVPPHSPIKSTAPLEPITLIPYGATMLRIAEIPTLA